MNANAHPSVSCAQVFPPPCDFCHLIIVSLCVKRRKSHHSVIFQLVTDKKLRKSSSSRVVQYPSLEVPEHFQAVLMPGFSLPGTLAVMGRSVVGWKEWGNGEISGWKQCHQAMTLNPGEGELSAGEVKPQRQGGSSDKVQSKCTDRKLAAQCAFRCSHLALTKP